MKRGIIAIAIILSLIPLVNANDLNDLIISPATVQLGDQFTISGDISNEGEKLESGFVIVRISKDDFIREYNADIDNGRFSVTTTLSKKSDDELIENAQYPITIFAKDGFGDETTFSNAGFLTINKDLKISVETAEDTLDPGDTLRLLGSAEKTSGEQIDGTVTFTLDDEKYTGTFKEGTFTFDIALSTNINSNNHDLIANIEDEYGNEAQSTLSFNVNPIETSLSIALEKREFLPNDVVNIQPILLDQAGDRILKEIQIKVIEGKRNKVINQNMQASDPLLLTLEQDAEPGKWKIELESDDLETTSEFIVKESAVLDIILEGDELLITNIGNVKYTKNLIISAEGTEKYTLERRTNLDTGESANIKLITSLEPGTYTIKVLDKSFENVQIVDDRSIVEKTGDSLSSITGNVVVAPGSSTSKTPFFITILLLAVLIVLVARSKLNQKKKKTMHKQNELKKAKKYKERLKEKLNIKNIRKPFKASKSDVESFKARILTNAKKEEERQRKMERETKRSQLFNILKPKEKEYPEIKKAELNKPKPIQPSFDIPDKIQQPFDIPTKEPPKEEKEEIKEEGNLFKMFD